MKEIKMFIILIACITVITSISCMSKNEKTNTAIKINNLNGNYILEYSANVLGTDNKYTQKGSISPWSIIHDGNKIIVENVAVGHIKDSTINFSGGPVNFGAGYGIIKAKGFISDSTITGTFTGTYYDNKYGNGKLSSASFILRKIRKD